MRKLFFILIFLILLIPSVLSAETSGWLGGFSISSEGFISDTIHSDAEYIGISLYVEPWNFSVLSPSLSAGVLIPAVPFEVERGYLSGEFALELFSLQPHPFSWVIDLENSYCPTIGIRALMPFDDPGIDSINLGATVSPFRLKTGSGRYSIFSLAYLFESDLSHIGWGLRLFDFRLFLL